jgi:hypothetical protein
MSYSKSVQYKLIFCGLSWGMATIAVHPAIAQAEVPVNLASLPESAAVSTQADDLLLSAIEQPKYFIDVEQVTYQARELDLEKFCQNYPYNSKCAGVNTAKAAANLKVVGRSRQRLVPWVLGGI